MNDKKAEARGRPPGRRAIGPAFVGGGYVHEIKILHAARGEAINAYAELEATLCRLFSCLAGVDEPTGSTIFYKIVSTRARTSILTNLMKLRFRTKWQPDFWTFIKGYWRTAISEVRTIDNVRNEIVHWHVGVDFWPDPESPRAQFQYEASLYSPQRIPMGTLTKTVREMDEFSVRCEFAAQSLMRLCFWLQGKPLDELAPWRDIFSRPLQYPPSPENPLFPICEALRIQLAASRR